MSVESLLVTPVIRRQLLPLSVDQYHQLCERDPSLRQTELIEGLIIAKMTKSPLPAYLINMLQAFFASKLPAGYLVRKEDPLTLATSEPEPDLAIVKGTLREFRGRHPVTAEWVIEIALSSLELDRAKAALYAAYAAYAAAGIAEYWIVIPQGSQVEVYTMPVGGQYRTLRIYTKAESIVTRWGVLDLATLFD
jgi:Uma2 family endonuclease